MLAVSQADDIKKVADYVAQLRRVGKGHGEGPRLPRAETRRPASALKRQRRARVPRYPTPVPHACPLCPAGVWQFDHELYEKEVRARATPLQ